MNLYDKIMERMVFYSSYIGTGSLVAVMLIIVANVIYRIFGGIIAGTYDLVETISVLVAAFALINTEFVGKHTRVDILIVHLKEKSKIWLDQLCNLISFVYWFTIAYATIQVTIHKAKLGETTDLLKISIIPFRSIWSFALFLMAVIVIYNSYRNFIELRKTKQ